MAGMNIPFNNVLHQYANHKRFKQLGKRQGRDPLSQADPSTIDDGEDAGNTLSLGRPSTTASLPDDVGGDEEDTTTTEPSITRTRTTTSSSTTSTSTSTTEDPDTSTTETTESSTSETSSTVSVITTTIESTSTSTSFSSEETTSSTPTTTLPDTTSLPTTTSPTTRALITSIVTASASLSRSSASNSLASSASDSSSSNGPSAGTVVGIVAGALVGVVVLSGIVGYVFRTKCSNKNDEDDFDGENPFGNMDNDGFGGRSGASRAELRRDSQLLADEGDSIHQMSELGHGAYGNAAPVGAMGAGAAAAGAYALHRDNSTGHASSNNNHLPGLSRNDTMNPRPPTMIQRHYAAQHQQQQSVPQMPSFQPGQIVYPSAQINQSGPYPSFPQPSANAVPIGGVFPSSNSNGDLNRNLSYREQQQQGYPSNAMNNDYQYGDNDGYGGNEMQPQRSGTPEYANPQQYFHQASDSFSSGVGISSPFEDSNASPARNFQHQQQYQQQQQGQYCARGYSDAMNGGSETLYADNAARSGAVKGSDRARRTLSVRNGGAVDNDDAPPRDSVYGGM